MNNYNSNARILYFEGSVDNIITPNLDKNNFEIIVFNCNEMKNIDKLYNEFSKKLKFPEYFGRNFNALNDCLTDLDWIGASGYLLIFKNSSSLLIDEPNRVIKGLIDILISTAKEWNTPVDEGQTWDRSSIPFYIFFQL